MLLLCSRIIVVVYVCTSAGASAHARNFPAIFFTAIFFPAMWGHVTLTFPGPVGIRDPQCVGPSPFLYLWGHVTLSALDPHL